MNLEQWTVGGRGFGTILVFVLMAGEIYTTFTFLGGSGFAYGHGAPAFYILSYGCLAYVLSYWLLPPIWRYAKEHRLIAQPDFFARKYDSPALGVLVALRRHRRADPLPGAATQGSGIIVDAAAYGAISPAAAIWIGAAVVTAYVMVSGVHGSAWTAVVKDTTILADCAVPGHLPAAALLRRLWRDVRRRSRQPSPTSWRCRAQGESVAWFDSTVLLTALGFYMWPHTFGSLYTAKEERAFRRNAALLPLYQLILLFVFFVGFAAILKVPGLKGPDIDLSLLRLSIQTFDPWFVGVIGAAGVLTALVPGSMILMASATLLANNIFRAMSSPQATDATMSRASPRCWCRSSPLIAVLFTLQRRHDDRGTAADGLQLCHAAFPGAGRQPAAAQSGHARRAPSPASASASPPSRPRP